MVMRLLANTTMSLAVCIVVMWASLALISACARKDVKTNTVIGMGTLI